MANKNNGQYKENKEQTPQKEKMQKWVDSPLYRTIAGGALGAGVGYALKPGTRKRILNATVLDKEEEEDKNCGKKVKNKASRLKDSALVLKQSGVQETQKVAKSLKNKVTNKSDNDNHKNKGKDKGNKYQSLKLENDELQGRLQQLEDKLNKLSKTKKK
ncbi:hypothetical protein J3T79_13665 [Staphylococcus nepalensis]|uniref:hypothetical protein n=1 Tax=Staphylococcus nepalensis TaxID=214473 RepID=UPI001A99EF25|nr:hypothetical protein [Staphylococcus nepalensis]MBO1217476.1 hypothetical protein [Staphylococcus nepalensis]